jgi:chloramphenicol 3-O phosphotransferase
MADKRRVILINGVSSAGKGSLARALQAITETPFLHVQMDAFLEMLPAAMFGDSEGYIFETTVADDKPVTAIHSGPMLDTLMRGMRRAIAAMAGAGADIIVDDVIWGGDLADYRAVMAPFDFRAVGLVAPLEVIEERERRRGDRTLGLARWQFDRVHAGMDYDLVVDNSQATPEHCAALIKRAFGL